MERTCKKCGETKPIKEYAKDRTTKTGYKSYCKSCGNIVAKIYREKNREICNKKCKEWRGKNIDRVRLRAKLYRETHKKEIKQRRKNWYDKNRIHSIKYAIEYQSQHLDSLKRYRKYYGSLDNVKKKNIKRDRYCRETLHDNYIKKQIKQHTGLSYEILNQHPELIEAKRIQLKLKRLTYENSNGTQR